MEPTTAMSTTTRQHKRNKPTSHYHLKVDGTTAQSL